MAVVVIVIAGPAADLRRFPIHQRNNGMVGNAAAFYAVIVNNVA